MAERQLCFKCLRPKRFCYCQYTKPIESGITFIFLTHPKEVKRQKTGTGRLAHLCLPNSRIIMGIDFTQNEELNQLLADERYLPLLMYPSPEAVTADSPLLREKLYDHVPQGIFQPVRAQTRSILVQKRIHAVRTDLLRRNAELRKKVRDFPVIRDQIQQALLRGFLLQIVTIEKIHGVREHRRHQIMKQSGERVSFANRLTFSMFYFYNEKHLLPLSHDEVVHGKKTVIDKIFGDYEMKFPQCRALYMYMAVHPGKKLNFMGNEIAMIREWDETKEPDYFLLQYPLHDSFHHYIMELNKVYMNEPALYEKDYDPDGFKWIAINDMQNNVYGIRRNGKTTAVAAFFNFSDKEHEYIYTPEQDETLTLVLHSDWDCFNGTVKKPARRKKIKARGIGGGRIELPAFSAALFEIKQGI